MRSALRCLCLVVAVATGLSCRSSTSESSAIPMAQEEDIIVMTPNYEARIIAYIEEFEASGRHVSAEFAAGKLARPDSRAPAEPTAEQRRQSRERRVELWGRLFRVIDALKDPTFDPEQEAPSYATVRPDEADMPDLDNYPLGTIDEIPPEEEEKRRKWTAKIRKEGIRYVEQFHYYRLDEEITELAESFFLSAFVRSAESVAIIERHAAAGHWTAARTQQVLGWVTPQR